MELWLTGAGMVTSVGADRHLCFDALCQGKTGLAPLQGFDAERFNVKNAFEIADRNGRERPFRATQWLGEVVRQAIAEADLLSTDRRVPVLVGTGLRELRTAELYFTEDIPIQPNQLHFADVVRKAVPSAGSVVTLSNACAASSYALALAEDLIRLGQADYVVTAGVDSITESMFGLMDRVNPTKPERVQVFDRNRRGMIMGEGAAAVVLESAEHARARGIEPLVCLLTVSASCDAVHETAPDRDGIERTIRDAHQRAGVKPADIDVIFVHGTGTYLNDSTEAAALSKIFPSDTCRFGISGIKSMIGHTSGASGLIGVITAAMSLTQKRIPPTVGLEDPISEAADMQISDALVERPDLRIAQINAFGFGGVNAVAILEGVTQ